MDRYVTILFGTPWNIFTLEQFDTVAILVYIEQLLVGNKRLSLYANAMMGAAMLLHPITFSIAWFFYGQLPFQIILDLFVYPFFPQFDTPQIPWNEYLDDPSDPNNW